MTVAPPAETPAPVAGARRAPGRLRRLLPLLGPAVVAATAYVDPGNFATNTVAGASHGMLLLWVIVAANLMAVLVQFLTAKLGLATGRNLPELCRDHYPRPVSRLLWVQAEAVAIATDLAEVVGGALALNLLFGVPLLPGGLAVGLVACALLAVQQRHRRRFELLVVAFFVGILVCLLTTLGQTSPDPAAVAGGLLPGLDGTDSLVLATGILGATVMPHVIYLHSDLTRDLRRRAGGTRAALRGQRFDLALGMGTAGVLNAVMLVVAATVFFRPDVAAPDDLEGVHAGLGTLAGPLAAGAFAVALLLSGLVSSGVGTYAGQVVMAGFLRRRIPLWVRRGVTLGPTLLLLGLGADPTLVLVVSQVVLSFGIPFALVPVLDLGRRRGLMGELTTRPAVTAVAGVLAAVVIGINVHLVVSVLA
ncbi:Nramp family divalent metal transporter [Actinomycetospora straminea]|uniref:Nramp family divalent metal transporter n=1 Tax=Actinomycetospora straminea TaxID=663607 RepID=A0ABP9F977_9PSEU|nr:Nramp family divalent metal transporter [Actinomycetospora straminea]MDD7936672.1 Nramp family divalent metal transporter [Actinomycetospora straminea]